MPNFTVHEGGRGGEEREGPDYGVTVAQKAFEDLVIETLRALARGEGAYRVGDALSRFVAAEAKASKPYMWLIHEAIADLDKRGFSGCDPESLDYHNDAIVRIALKMAAEGMATDGLARARRSKSYTTFRQEIEEWIVEHERRSRERGWSFVRRLTDERLGPWSPPKGAKPRAAKRKRKSPPRPDIIL